MSTQPTVLVTVPKYVAITPVQAQASSDVSNRSSTPLPRIRPVPSLTPATENPSGITLIKDETQAPKGKKRRLDHLTWEEKVQRKKLKNRVAAQTSRDRKKARMEEMEYELQELTEKTEMLVNKCESLQVINDSLLEKNQKLDMEVEQLRQQLEEIQNHQQQHNSITCAGCESLLNGSAAGLKPQGSTVITGENCSVKIEGTAQKECNSVISVASNSSMSSLQDMLLPDIKFAEGTLTDAEFDAGKLEELAESLLADITADLEANDRASNAFNAETACGTQRLPESVVGPTTECMEPCQHKSPNGSSLESIIIADDATIPTSILSNSNINSIQTLETMLENKFEQETTAATIEDIQTTKSLNINNTTRTATALMAAISSEISVPEIIKSSSVTVTPDTVYGTYDAKTNSITIVMDDVAVPVSEAVEEIYCDGAVTTDSSDEVLCTSGMTSPSHVYLNIPAYSDDETDFDDEINFDPIEKFLCPKRPLVSPLAKSPAPLNSSISDHGYGSMIGSPTPPSHHFESSLSEELDNDFFSIWPTGFNELFPSLI